MQSGAIAGNNLHLGSLYPSHAAAAEVRCVGLPERLLLVDLIGAK